jgi:hypothetical protein
MIWCNHLLEPLNVIKFCVNRFVGSVYSLRVGPERVHITTDDTGKWMRKAGKSVEVKLDPE